jgi:hypothetical protein
MLVRTSRLSKLSWISFISFLLLVLCFTSSTVITLAQSPAVSQPLYTRLVAYDAATRNDVPDTNILIYAASGTGPGGTPVGASQTFDSAKKATILDTLADTNDHAGDSISNNSVPTLDPTLGYRFSFTAQVISETHSSNDRAGFSAIVLGQDHQGIELGFWPDRIWAQNAGFTHGEEISYTTTAGLVSYQILVQGSSYYLFANNTQILTGTLRDYCPNFLTCSNPVPYFVPNFTFIGDDTTSAKAKVAFSAVSAEANVQWVIVTDPGDGAVQTPPSAPVTLRQAINNVSPTSDGAVITFDQSMLGANVPALTASLTLPAGFQVQAACSPRQNLTMAANTQLLLGGNNLLQGLVITRSAGSTTLPAISTAGPGNRLLCTKVVA